MPVGPVLLGFFLFVVVVSSERAPTPNSPRMSRALECETPPFRLRISCITAVAPRATPLLLPAHTAHGMMIQKLWSTAPGKLLDLLQGSQDNFCQ